MCIAIVKKIGAALPDDFIDVRLRNGSIANPQGAGFAVKRKGEKKILIRKGFMKFEPFAEAVKEANIQREDEAIFHCRVATCGSLREENTHPFVINPDPVVSAMIKGFAEGDDDKPLVMIHNGGFHQYDKGWRDPYNDSFYFAKEVLGKYDPKLGARKLRRWQHKFKKAMGAYNKIAVMFPNHPVELYGTFYYYEGIFYSTTQFKGERRYPNNYQDDWRGMGCS